MTKTTITKKVSGVILKAAKNMAWNDSSQLCLYYLYQPKKPYKLKKK